MEGLFSSGTNSVVVSGIMIALLYDVLKLASKTIMSKAIQSAANTHPSIIRLSLYLIRDIALLGMLVSFIWLLPSELKKHDIIALVMALVGIPAMIAVAFWHGRDLRIALRRR